MTRLYGRAGKGERIVDLGYPCSSDLTLIEKMWSKIKQILCSIKAGMQKTLLAALAAALECAGGEEALGWVVS